MFLPFFSEEKNWKKFKIVYFDLLGHYEKPLAVSYSASHLVSQSSMDHDAFFQKNQQFSKKMINIGQRMV